MEEIPLFSSLVTRQVLDGDKVKVDDLLNKEIVVCGFNVSASKFKDKGACTKVQFYYSDDDKKERKVFFSGSSVIKEQLEEVKASLERQGKQMLFKSMVKKVGNYYSLV